MTSTTVQLDHIDLDFSSSLEHEIFLLSPALTQGGSVFHDASEELTDIQPSLLDRLPASFQELSVLLYSYSVKSPAYSS